MSKDITILFFTHHYHNSPQNLTHILVEQLLQDNASVRVDSVADIDWRIVGEFIAAFVRDVRMVSFDRHVQNEAIWRAYALLQSSTPATIKIGDFMQDPASSPMKRTETHSVGIEILSVLQQTAETWEVN